MNSEPTRPHVDGGKHPFEKGRYSYKRLSEWPFFSRTDYSIARPQFPGQAVTQGVISVTFLTVKYSLHDPLRQLMSE